MPKVNGLTPKQKHFCREYIANGGKAKEAYMVAYDSTSPTSASVESCKLLKRDDVTEYIETLTKPIENRARNERQRKRAILWEMINNPNTKDSDRLGAMNILNKMDGAYSTTDETETDTQFETMSTEKIIQLIG